VLDRDRCIPVVKNVSCENAMSQSSRFCRSLLAVLLIAFALLPIVSRPSLSHDFPNEIVVRSFVRPAGDRLTFLVRIPLALLEGTGLPKRGPGYLDLARSDEMLDRITHTVGREFVLYEDGARLVPVSAWRRVSQPSENRFGTFAEARAHVLGPALPEKSNVFWNQGYLDVALEYAIGSDRSRFALDVLAWSGLSGRVKVFVQYLPPTSDPRVFQVHGGQGWLELDPSWYRAASTFVVLGFEHILGGIDHLLFLLCLLLPFRVSHIWHLAGIATAFTVAHSITLIASATGAVPMGNWFPPLIEALIAISILYMACENIVSSWLRRPVGALRWRWLTAGFFGLIHGFGFSFVLEQDLQYTGPHVMVSLIAFNLGVEVGQLAFLIVVVRSLALALRRLDVQRVGVVLISAVVAHTAWHWMIERGSALRFIRWPTLEVSWNAIWLLAVAIILVAAISVLALLAIRSRRDLWPGARERDTKTVLTS
jgi:hypothetical protein